MDAAGAAAAADVGSGLHAVFRVDGGFRVGMGHLARCLTLAAEMSRYGAEIDFLTGPLPDAVAGQISQRGYGHRVLGADDSDPATPGTVWSSGAQRRDAEVVGGLMQAGVDVLVVDHYGLDERWERIAAQGAGRTVVIDDLANRPHACDVLVDQNWSGPPTADRYAGLVPAAATKLIGPRYALLDPVYARLREQGGARTHEGRRVVVSFGGSDPTGETAKVLAALVDMGEPDLSVDVVLGAGSHDRAGELESVPGVQVTFHTSLPTLAYLFSRAHLAAGAGGITTWERICLGVPSLVTTVAPNQVPVTAALHRAGAIVWLGDAHETTAEGYRSSLRAAFVDGPPAPPAIVDGWGARRVALCVLGHRPADLSLRAARDIDAPAFFDVERVSQPDRVESAAAAAPWAEPLAQLSSDLADPARRPHVVVLDGAPVGFVSLVVDQRRVRASSWLDRAVVASGTGSRLNDLIAASVWDPAAARLVTAPHEPAARYLPVSIEA